MSLKTTPKNDHWDSSMLSGVQFIFKDKTTVVPDITSRFTDLQSLNHDYLYDFELEREVLKVYKMAEQLEEGKTITNDDKGIEATQSYKHHSLNLTLIEPKKTSVAMEEQPRPYSNRSLVEDFEFQGSQDDPFVAAELGVINDMEELRDVLASMPVLSSQNSDVTRKNISSSLKNISFPRLSADENSSDYAASSGSISQPNLFSQSLAHNSEYPTNSSTETEIEVFKHVNSNACISQKSASPVQLDPYDKTVKSEGLSSQYKLLVSDQNDYGDGQVSCSLSLPNVANKTPLSSAYSNSSHVPISLELKVESNSNKSPAPLEVSIDSCADDPPIVQRLVKMGFRRSQVVAVYDATVGGRNDDTLITQLCNWNELEEKGVAKEVGKAAVIFSPNDLEKALEFAALVSEMIEMGFPFDSVILAVQSSNMDKEKVIYHLLDSGENPGTASSSHSTDHNQFHRSILDSLARPIGRKNKKKDKKQHLASSYLHARH